MTGPMGEPTGSGARVTGRMGELGGTGARVTGPTGEPTEPERV